MTAPTRVLGVRRCVARVQARAKETPRGTVIHPATRTFQALRIASMETGRPARPSPAARCWRRGAPSIISFHYPGGIVKHSFLGLGRPSDVGCGLGTHALALGGRAFNCVTTSPGNFHTRGGTAGAEVPIWGSSRNLLTD